MDSETWYAYATLAAIVVGPIAAVLITRFLDSQGERTSRRLQIYRDLMQTRGLRLDPLHVAALNVLEVEFYKDISVRTAHKNYIGHLSSPMPQVNEQDRYFEQRADLFGDLLSEVGKAVGYNFDKRDIERQQYVPQAWDTDHGIQRKNAVLLSQILSGERAIPVTSIIVGNNPYPEPPRLEGPEKGPQA